MLIRIDTIVVILLLNYKNHGFQDTHEALKELSTFFITDYTPNTRRNLRNKIEKRSLFINDEFLTAFKEVKSTLDNIHMDVLTMNNSIRTMIDHVQNSKTQTLSLINRTTKLQNERY